MNLSWTNHNTATTQAADGLQQAAEPFSADCSVHEDAISAPHRSAQRPIDVPHL